jgi:hypothetical protein
MKKYSELYQDLKESQNDQWACSVATKKPYHKGRRKALGYHDWDVRLAEDRKLRTFL